MRRNRIFDFTSLPPDYLDDAVRGLEPHSEHRPTLRQWRRIPLDLMPLRCRTHDSGSGLRWYVIASELAVAICRGLGGHDCGCDGDEPVARWIKSRLAIRRHAMRLKP